MSKKIEDLIIVRKQRLTPYHFIITLKTNSETLPQIFPGQFVEVLVENSPTTYLRRPISIHDVDFEEKTISLFIKIVGQGTRRLSWLEEGDFVNVMYPLGNSYETPNNSNVLLIGGGFGVAPLFFLAKTLSEKGIQPIILIGGKTKDDILLKKEISKYGKVYITTEDGSEGEKGFVTNHSIFLESIESKTPIKTCGPEPMMKAIGKISVEKQIDCEVSLENTMACGIGACLCCVVETKEGNVCTCTDGPVFNIKELTSWH